MQFFYFDSTLQMEFVEYIVRRYRLSEMFWGSAEKILRFDTGCAARSGETRLRDRDT